jgi:hypothetical protein
VYREKTAQFTTREHHCIWSHRHENLKSYDTKTDLKEIGWDLIWLRVGTGGELL